MTMIPAGRSRSAFDHSQLADARHFHAAGLTPTPTTTPTTDTDRHHRHHRHHRRHRLSPSYACHARPVAPARHRRRRTVPPAPAPAPAPRRTPTRPPARAHRDRNRPVAHRTPSVTGHRTPSPYTVGPYRSPSYTVVTVAPSVRLYPSCRRTSTVAVPYARPYRTHRHCRPSTVGHRTPTLPYRQLSVLPSTVCLLSFNCLSVITVCRSYHQHRQLSVNCQSTLSTCHLPTYVPVPSYLYRHCHRTVNTVVTVPSTSQSVDLHRHCRTVAHSLSHLSPACPLSVRPSPYRLSSVCPYLSDRTVLTAACTDCLSTTVTVAFFRRSTSVLSLSYHRTTVAHRIPPYRTSHCLPSYRQSLAFCLSTTSQHHQLSVSPFQSINCQLPLHCLSLSSPSLTNTVNRTDRHRTVDTVTRRFRSLRAVTVRCHPSRP